MKSVFMLLPAAIFAQREADCPPGWTKTMTSETRWGSSWHCQGPVVQGPVTTIQGPVQWGPVEWGPVTTIRGPWQVGGMSSPSYGEVSYGDQSYGESSYREPSYGQQLKKFNLGYDIPSNYGSYEVETNGYNSYGIGGMYNAPAPSYRPVYKPAKSYGNERQEQSYGQREHSYGQREQSYQPKRSYERREHSYGQREQTYQPKRSYERQEHSYGQREQTYTPPSREIYGTKRREQSYGRKYTPKSYGIGGMSYPAPVTYGNPIQNYGNYDMTNSYNTVTTDSYRQETDSYRPVSNYGKKYEEKVESYESYTPSYGSSYGRRRVDDDDMPALEDAAEAPVVEIEE